MNTMVDLVCAECDKPFQVIKGREQRSRRGGGKGPRLYCNPHCRTIALNRRKKGVTRDGGMRLSMATKPCETCSTLFTAKSCERRRFCSWDCFQKNNRPDEATRGKLREVSKRRWATGETPMQRHIREHGAWNKGTGRMFEVTCKQCGKTQMLPPRSGPGRYHDPRVFCNRTCQSAYRTAHPETCYRWRGGRYDPYGPNWVRQSRAARERDQHMCQYCGLHRERPRLDVHHIKPRREFDENWDAANALWNLITVCRKCHREIEPD